MSGLILAILISGLSSIFMFIMSFCSMQNVKPLAFVLSLSSLFILIFTGNGILGDEINYPWIEELSINFHLKVDGLSLLFLYVTAIILPIAILAVKENSSAFFGLILLLQTLLFIFFTARDLAVFTIFFEATIMPLYFMITLYGGAGRKKAAIQFVIYMIAGSFLLIAAVLSLYFSASLNFGKGSFNLDLLSQISDALPHASSLFAIFILAFAVKTPIFPFHGWLPGAYTEASTAGTIILSAVLSKTGIYGILRIGKGLFPSEMQEWSPYLLVLAVFSVLYGGFAAWRQTDHKKLIAYSSFSHVNMILAGLFVTSYIAETGSLLQVINHAVTITGLFLVASFLEERISTRTLNEHRGLAKSLPLLCWITLIFVIASIAVPGTNNFIGELLIFLGIFNYNPPITATLGLTIILSAIYMLRYMQLNFFGSDDASKKQLADIGLKEILILLPLIILIFYIGIYPQNILHELENIR